MYVLKKSQQLSSVAMLLQQCWSRAAALFLTLLSLGTIALRHLGSWCTGMLVYCTHICILTWPLDMLTIVVCMSSSSGWKLTVSIRLTTLLGEKDISWIKCSIHCTLYKVKCWSKTLIYTHNVCWTENHCWIQLVLVVLLTSLLHAQLR